MASYEITGALIDGSFVDRTLPVGSYNGKLFVVAFESLFRNDTFTGENRIRGFKSTDGGHTWTAVGSTFRTEDGWFDAAVDGRLSDSHPYIHITTNSTDRVFYYLRFNMASETFDTQSGFHARRFLGFNRSYIGCNDLGEVRIVTSEGVITENPDHTFGTDEPPRFWTITDSDAGGVGGGGTVPGMTFAGNYAPMAVSPGPAGGAHPPGAQGWYYIMVKAEYVSGVYHQSTRWFDDGGAEHTFDDGNDARTHATFRHRAGKDPETMILNFFPSFTEGATDITGWTYGTEIITNTGAEIQCEQSQVPPIFVQGFHYTGGGVVLSRAGTFYLVWMNGTDIGYKTCPGDFTDCSSWTAAQTLNVLPSAGTTSIIGMYGGGVVPGGVGLLFGDYIDPSTVDQIFNVKYTLLPASEDQQITGETGIPSAEDFGKTFGVSGDVVQCGTLNTDVIPSGCGPDTPIVDEGGGNCQGFNGYSF